MQPTSFSILIAAYNAAAFLPAAFASIAAQTHTHWELIVVEDGSHDGTETLVNAFAAAHPEHRIVYDNLGRNRGVAAARNRLLALAQADAVAFLDADDQWMPDHLASLATCLAEKSHVIACTPVALWDGDHEKPLGTYAPTPQQVASPRLELFRTSFIWTSTCVALPRSTIQQVGGFDETLRIGEDRDYWFRALAGGGTLGLTASPTARYTKHAASSMTRTLRVSEDTVAFYRKHHHTTAVPARLRRRLLAEALWIHGRLLHASDKTQARKLLREAVRIQPLNPRYWPHLLR